MTLEKRNKLEVDRSADESNVKSIKPFMKLITPDKLLGYYKWAASENEALLKSIVLKMSYLNMEYFR